MRKNDPACQPGRWWVIRVQYSEGKWRHIEPLIVTLWRKARTRGEARSMVQRLWAKSDWDLMEILEEVTPAPYVPCYSCRFAPWLCAHATGDECGDKVCWNCGEPVRGNICPCCEVQI